jgi:hypothetical protein
MALIDLFSSRQKKNQPVGDVWVYDQIPPTLRMQASNIIEGALGPIRDYGYSSGPLYQSIRARARKSAFSITRT